MNVQEDLKMCNKDGVWTLHGLKEMGGTANSVDSMLHPELALADHVLQYMYHGLSGFRMPFCYYATKQANAAQLYSMTSKCLSALAAHEFEIVYISLDGSSNNRSWIKLLMPDPLGCKMTFTSRIDGSQKIVVIPDPSHVLKKIRNAAAQSDPSFKDASNTFSRLLVWNGYEIIWQHWIDAYEWSKNRDLNPLSPHRHLTCESIHLTTIGKMRNNFAYETLNDRMLTLMKAYKASPHLSPQQSEKLAGTVAFLENTAVLVRNFRDTHKLEDPSDPRLQENDQVLKWFSEWENNTPQAEKQKHLMSSQCREDLSWMLVGFKQLTINMHQRNISIIPADINSDVIENYFCSQRGVCSGNNSNPDLRTYGFNTNRVILGQPITSSKGNASMSSRAAEPYNMVVPGPLVHRKPFC